MKKRILSTLLALCMMLALLPGTAYAVTVSSGKCGDNVTWSLDSNGTLSITGTGAMYDYGTAPWYARRSDLVKVRISDGITRVGNYAFERCNNITSIELGSSIITIGNGAFEYCSNLASIYLPQSLGTIGSLAFYNCSRLKSIYYAGSESQWNNINIVSNNFSYLFASGCRIYYAGSPNTSSLVSGSCGNNATWSLNGSGVLTITGSGAMYDYGTAPWYYRRSDLVKVCVSDGITNVGNYAFERCNNVTSVELGSSIITIGNGAFEYCSNLASIYLPQSLGTIGSLAFYNCNRLKSIYYAGSESQWNNINITSNNNTYLYSTDSRIYYNYGVPTQKYTVKFDPNGGAGSVTTKTYSANASLGALPSTSRTGYTFSGWYTAKSGGTKMTTTSKVTKDMTLYARWTKNAAAKKYTVTFNANGGNVSTKTKSVTNGSAYGALPTPTKSGYTFLGWFTSTSGGTQILSTTKVSLTKNQTLYARWEKKNDEETKTYLVSFDANGGTVYLKSKTVLRGSRYRDLPTPTRPGWHFAGWYTAKSGGSLVTSRSWVSKTSNHTLYARWSTSPVSVRLRDTDDCLVYIPPYCKLPLYASEVTAAQTTVYPAQSSEYSIRCSKMVELSNGTTRYYGKIGAKSYWFQFTSEMEVDD